MIKFVSLIGNNRIIKKACVNKYVHSSSHKICKSCLKMSMNSQGMMHFDIMDSGEMKGVEGEWKEKQKQYF